MKKKTLLLMIIATAVILSCSTRKEASNESMSYQEPYRPQYHFSPAINWTNDPNGLVYYDGEYHIFYQYNPYGNTWGHMSWGHAVSKDLVHWEHLPVALSEYQDPKTNDSTMIFSGTVVVDKNNSSGLCTGKDCLIAIYTSHVHANNQGLVQHQSLAYSNDRGRTWNRYDKNPILDIQRKDFRDPKVFWYEPEKKWVMVLVIPDQFIVRFYESKNLIQWIQSGEFGNAGDVRKIWECPDLYELPVEGQPGKTKWVLSMSCSHPQGGNFVGMQYFIGSFDGKTFKADEKNIQTRYVDYGKDFYAGIVYNNFTTQSGNPIMIGWANNWAYGKMIPTSPWRSAMSVPRELSLLETPDGLQLAQRPWTGLLLMKGEPFGGEIKGTSYWLEVEMDGKAENAGVKVLKSNNEETIIGYKSAEGALYVDRTKSGNTSFHNNFASVESAEVTPVDGKIKLQVLVDQSIIEVFANDGLRVITDQVFPAEKDAKVEVFGEGVSLKAWPMKSVWR